MLATKTSTNSPQSTQPYTPKYFSLQGFCPLQKTVGRKKVNSYQASYVYIIIFLFFCKKTASFGKIPLSSEMNINRFLRVYKPLFHPLCPTRVWNQNSENLFTSSPPDQQHFLYIKEFQMYKFYIDVLKLSSPQI